MNARRLVAYLAVAGSMLIANSATANLLRNASFEQTPCVTPCNQDQAYLPSDWLSLSVTPDTYSNDGSYGAAPDAWGNFIGATAQDGIRFVAAWSYAGEILGQALTAPLVPGTSYTLSGYLRQSVRRDLANPGTYQIELWSSTDAGTSSKVVLGSFDAIANQNAWEQRTLTFTAPTQAATHTVLAFRALKTRRGEAYPALDNLSLLATGTGGGGGGATCSGSGSATVVINSCDTGVPNFTTSGSTCIATDLAACTTASKNHGQYVSCVALLTNSWVSAGIITGQQKGSIESCAAQNR